MYKTCLSTVVVLSLAAVLTGCGDTSDSTSPAGTGTVNTPTPPAASTTTPAAGTPASPTDAAVKAASETVDALSADATKAADKVAAAAREGADAAQKAVSEVGTAAQEKITSLVNDVKQLLSDGKTTEAAQRLQSALAGLKLTPEQQKIVDDLKAKAKEALSKSTSDAAKAVGDLLNPKPALPASNP